MYYWEYPSPCFLMLDEAFVQEFLTLNAEADGVHRGEDYDRMSVFVYPEGYTELPYNLLTDEAGGYQLDTGDRFIQADALCATLLELLGLTLPSIDAIDYPYPTHASP